MRPGWQDSFVHLSILSERLSLRDVLHTVSALSRTTPPKFRGVSVGSKSGAPRRKIRRLPPRDFQINSPRLPSWPPATNWLLYWVDEGSQRVGAGELGGEAVYPPLKTHMNVVTSVDIARRSTRDGNLKYAVGIRKSQESGVNGCNRRGTHPVRTTPNYNTCGLAARSRRRSGSRNFASIEDRSAWRAAPSCRISGRSSEGPAAGAILTCMTGRAEKVEGN